LLVALLRSRRPGGRNWGYKLRFGLFEIGAADMDGIEQAMGVAGAREAFSSVQPRDQSPMHLLHVVGIAR